MSVAVMILCLIVAASIGIEAAAALAEGSRRCCCLSRLRSSTKSIRLDEPAAKRDGKTTATTTSNLLKRKFDVGRSSDRLDS